MICLTRKDVSEMIGYLCKMGRSFDLSSVTAASAATNSFSRQCFHTDGGFETVNI